MRDLRLGVEFLIGSEIGIIVVGVILVIGVIFAPRSIIDTANLQSFATGCATVSGVLAAFTGFWLTHIYSNASEQTKKWLSKRIALIVPLIGFGLICVLGGLSGLIYDTPEEVVARINLGVGLILLVDLEVCLMTLYRGFGKKEIGL